MINQSHTCTETSPAKWVENMQAHFREKGFYRAEDVQKLLGDPCESVGMCATTDLNQLARDPRT